MRVALVLLVGCGFSKDLALVDEPVDAAIGIDAPVDAPAGCVSTPFTCPTGYVFVPNNCAYGTGDFCIAKYEAKNASSAAVSVATGVPWGSINVTQAKAACAANGGGYHLVTNAEWMAVARAIEATPDNWSTTTTPFLSKGKTDNCGNCTTAPRPANCPGPASSDGDPCFESTASGCANRGNTNFRFNRTHRIGNAVIWDFSGNMFELVDHPPTRNATQGVWPGDPINMTSGATFVPALTDAQYKSANLAHRDAPTQGSPIPQPAVENIGILYATSATDSPNFTRGGDYCGFSGIYAIGLLRDSELGLNVGFRCAFKP